MHLDGVGRKIYMKKNLFDVMYEGQFKDNELNGFGRKMKAYMNGDIISYIGHWKNGKKHGYGVQTYSSGQIRAGLYQNGNFCKRNEDVNSYDIVKDPISKPFCHLYPMQ